MWDRIRSFISTLTSGMWDFLLNPARIITAPDKLRKQSLPVHVGLIVFSLLTLLVVSVWFLQTKSGLKSFENIQFPLWDKDDIYKSIFLISVLILLASIASSWMTHVWMVRIPSLYPEIDEAWNQGVKDLRAHGILLEDHPIYVLLGVSNTADADAMMRSSGLNLDVKPASAGLKPLLWYAGQDRRGNVGIFLFLCDCCQTSSLVGGRGREEVKGGISSQAAGATIDGVRNYVAQTIQGFQGVKQRKPKPRPMAQMRTVSDLGDESSLNIQRGRLKQTISNAPAQESGTAHDSVDDRFEKPAEESISRDVRTLKADTVKTLNNKLWYVCELLKGARLPDCPLNGLAVAAPYELLKNGGSKQAEVLAEATWEDLQIITESLGLRSHVLALVTGLEEDCDFPVFLKRTCEYADLMNRSAKEYLNSRFGKGLEPWVEANDERLELLAQRACDSIENQIYNCFRATLSLSKLDNGQLYRFLANVRSRLLPSLQQWLVNGFAIQDSSEYQEFPQLSGCYLLSSRPSSDHSGGDGQDTAFVPGVFDKFFETMGEIEWTRKSLRSDARYQFASHILSFLTLVAVVAAGIVGYLMYQKNLS